MRAQTRTVKEKAAAVRGVSGGQMVNENKDEIPERRGQSKTKDTLEGQ
jgi:hypothetical protein